MYERLAVQRAPCIEAVMIAGDDIELSAQQSLGCPLPPVHERSEINLQPMFGKEAALFHHVP